MTKKIEAFLKDHAECTARYAESMYGMEPMGVIIRSCCKRESLLESYTVQSDEVLRQYIAYEYDEAEHQLSCYRELRY